MLAISVGAVSNLGFRLLRSGERSDFEDFVLEKLYEPMSLNEDFATAVSTASFTLYP